MVRVPPLASRAVSTFGVRNVAGPLFLYACTEHHHGDPRYQPSLHQRVRGCVHEEPGNAPAATASQPLDDQWVVAVAARVRELELSISSQEVVLAPRRRPSIKPSGIPEPVSVRDQSTTPRPVRCSATRRPRSNDEQRLWAAHVAMVDDTSRAVIRWLPTGAGRSIRGSSPAVEQRRSISRSSTSACGRGAWWLEPSKVNLHASVRRRLSPSQHNHRNRGLARTRTPGFECSAWDQSQVQVSTTLGIDAGEAHVFGDSPTGCCCWIPRLRPPGQDVLANVGWFSSGRSPDAWGSVNPWWSASESSARTEHGPSCTTAEGARGPPAPGLDVDVRECPTSTALRHLHESLESLVRADQSTLGHRERIRATAAFHSQQQAADTDGACSRELQTLVLLRPRSKHWPMHPFSKRARDPTARSNHSGPHTSDQAKHQPPLPVLLWMGESFSTRRRA